MGIKLFRICGILAPHFLRHPARTYFPARSSFNLRVHCSGLAVAAQDAPLIKLSKNAVLTPWKTSFIVSLSTLLITFILEGIWSSMAWSLLPDDNGHHYEQVQMSLLGRSWVSNWAGPRWCSDHEDRAHAKRQGLIDR